MVLLINTFTKIELPSNFDVIVNIGLSIPVGMGVLIDLASAGIADSVGEDTSK